MNVNLICFYSSSLWHATQYVVLGEVEGILKDEVNI